IRPHMLKQGRCKQATEASVLKFAHRFGPLPLHDPDAQQIMHVDQPDRLTIRDNKDAWYAGAVHLRKHLDRQSIRADAVWPPPHRLGHRSVHKSALEGAAQVTV